jgi:tetratricopeptide (TPR) repeat protein
MLHLSFTLWPDETDDPDEKAAIFANEHKCYCQLGWLDKANALMRQIRSLPHQDKFVRMIVDFADACMMAQMAKLDEGALKFERILDSNRELLASSDNRNLYEDIQERRAFLLAGLGRYTEALPILEEAVSFTNGESDPKLVHFYLGRLLRCRFRVEFGKGKILARCGPWTRRSVRGLCEIPSSNALLHEWSVRAGETPSGMCACSARSSG